MAITFCISFSFLPDNMPMPHPTFSWPGGGNGNNYVFAEPGSANPRWFINQSGTGRGLQFANTGMKVKLPAPTTRIRVQLGQFASPIVVRAFDAAGNDIGALTTNHPNAFGWHALKLRRRAVMLAFTGGGHEGILADLCGVY